MGKKTIFGHDWVSKTYLDRYPNSSRTWVWSQRVVLIRTEHGIWRANGCSYTYDKQEAGWYTFLEAWSHIKDLGPEKQACLLLPPEKSDLQVALDRIKELENEVLGLHQDAAGDSL